MDYIINGRYKNYIGKTIRDFIKGEAQLSHRLLTLLKNKNDGILVNNIKVTVRYVFAENDVLSLNYEADCVNGESNVAENDTLLDFIDIAYEDEYITAFNKPHGMPSHPSINHFDDTLANAAVSYFKSKNLDIYFRSANRLDKNTSGIVLTAKDRVTSAKLNEMIKNRQIKKVYTAVAVGDISLLGYTETEKINDMLKHIGGEFYYDDDKKTGKIIAPIKRERESIIKRICDIGGDYARTDFKVLQTGERVSLLEVYPKTGRTHQIRVHFQKIGFPLVGDDLYYTDISEVKCGEKIIQRHALHASSLEFTHPMTGRSIVIECGMPTDMKDLIDMVFFSRERW